MRAAFRVASQHVFIVNSSGLGLWRDVLSTFFAAILTGMAAETLFVSDDLPPPSGWLRVLNRTGYLSGERGTSASQLIQIGLVGPPA
jgi:hypothetical protein